MNLEFRPLDARANSFVEACLKSGRRLAQLVAAKHHPANSGTVRAWLPTGVGEPYQFDYSLATPGVARAADDSVTAFLAVFVARGSTCVFEHQLAAPRDPVLQRKRRHIAIGNDVYFVAPSEPDVEGVREAFRESRTSPVHIGFVSRRPFTELASYADEVQAVCVSGYDGDSYLVWTPDSETALAR